MVSITPDETALLTKYVNQITGIKLDPEKRYLLESRFQPLLNEFRCNNYRELYDKAQSDRSGSVMNRMVDAITTNETYFFRDSKPFELLSNKIIPEMIDRKRKETGSRKISIKIWSAACSTGQEMYSIGITLSELLKDIHQHNISILGTDISDDVIARASYGQYNRFEVERGLPSRFLNKYFTKTANGWRVKDTIRTMARFEKRDLLKPFTDLGRFDIIFCRNVAIYFDNKDKKNLFKKIAQALLPGGSLIVGASESLTGTADDFAAQHYLKSIYYQLKDDKQIADAPKPGRARPTRQPPPPGPVKQPPRPAVRTRPALDRSKPLPKPKKAEPPPPVTEKPLHPAPAEPGIIGFKQEQGRSLLSTVGRKETGKGSLLSRVRDRKTDSKKTLPDNVKTESSG